MNGIDDLTKALEIYPTARALSEALGVASSTVRSWRARGSVPEAYRERLQRMAAADPTKPPTLPAIPPGHHARGVSTLVDGSGNVRLQWLKSGVDHETREETIARLAATLSPTIPARPAMPVRPGPVRDDLLAVYPLGDPHVGLLAWGQETGADFDLQIAEDLHAQAIHDLVERGPRTRTALLLNLGDYFHADNANHHTTRGSHPLDVDGRMSKVLDVGQRIAVRMVDALLRHHDRVIVDMRKGNHDEHTAVCLALIIRSHFRNDHRVECEIPHGIRRYHEFGRNMIATSHGDKGKRESYGQLMAAEAPEIWGRTKFRVMFTGHVHHKSVIETPGVLLESFGTLAARDSWHAGQGYLSHRDLHRITYHVEYGQIERQIAGLEWIQEKLAQGA